MGGLFRFLNNQIAIQWDGVYAMLGYAFQPLRILVKRAKVLKD